MATQFSFQLPDKPGSLANVAEAISNAGINIDGISGIAFNGQGLVHIVTSNPDATVEALNGAGLSFKQEDAFFLKMPNSPGQIAKFSRSLADAGINMTSIFVTMEGQQVVATDNNEKSKEIASSLGML